MKKYLGLLLVATSLLTVSLTASSQSNKFEPYLGVGATLSSGQFSQGAEVGIYNNRTWFAATVSTVDQFNDRQWYGGVKTYYKISGRTQMVETYLSTAVGVHLAKDAAITLEPGAAVVVNLSDRVAPQFSVGFPISENTTSPLKPLTVNFGIGLNFWLY